jgi:hypothetical protein
MDGRSEVLILILSLILAYILLGMAITLLRAAYNRMLRDALDVAGAIFLWPVTLGSWFPYKYRQ